MENPQSPVTLTMKTRRNDLSLGEKAHIKALGGGDRLGSQKYDFVPIKSAFIYRCPIPGCVSPLCPEKKGLPKNANGVKNHMKCHVARNHTGFCRELRIRVETRFGRIQHHATPCIAATKERKRYGTKRYGT